MTSEELKEAQKRVEREKALELIIQTCAMAMVKTRERKVHDDACDLLRRVGAIAPDVHRRLLKSWSQL